MRKLGLIVVTAVFLAMAGNVFGDAQTPDSSCCWDYPRGDANCSQNVNILDITYVISYVYQGGPEPCCLAAADINCDCVINMSDINIVIIYMFQLIWPPPVPCSCETWENNCWTGN